MRILRWGAFVTWLIVAGVAVAGFAAFSPEPATAPSPPAADETVISSGRGTATGRLASLAFAIGTRETQTSLATVATQAAVTATFAEPTPDSRPTPTSPPTTAASSTTVAPATTPATSAPTTTPPTTQATTTTVAAPSVPPGDYQWPTGSSCEASWYGPGFEGRPTASGEPFDPQDLTAAIHDLPFGTLVVVTRTDTGDAVTVRVNDRGPFLWDNGWKRHPTRCIDLSRAAMNVLGGLGEGVIDVTINY
jgi:rare lipoprotein A